MQLQKCLDPLLEIKHPKYGVMEVFKATKVHIPSISFNEPSQIKQITLSFFLLKNLEHELKFWLLLIRPSIWPFFGIFVTFYTWPIICARAILFAPWCITMFPKPIWSRIINTPFIGPKLFWTGSKVFGWTKTFLTWLSKKKNQYVINSCFWSGLNSIKSLAPLYLAFCDIKDHKNCLVLGYTTLLLHT